MEVEAEVEVEAIRSWNSFWTSSSFCVIRFMTFFITIGTCGEVKRGADT